MQDFSKFAGMFQAGDPKNPRIMGAGTLAGGAYDSVTIQGAGRITGSVEAKTLDLRGAVSAGGGVKCGSASFSGAVTVSGPVTAETFVAGGAFDISGALTARSVSIELGGRCRAETITAPSIAVRQGTGTAGAISGGAASGGHGGIAIGPNANARGGSVHISQSGLGESSVTIEPPGSSTESRLDAETISGETVELAYTRAKLVKGKRVTLGAACEIETVEYTESFSADKSSKIGKAVKR